MKYLKLRIGWSVMWGLTAVSVIVLWARSYQHYDFASHNFFGSQGVIIESIRGVAFIKYAPGAPIVNGYGSSAPDPSRKPAGTFPTGTWGGFAFSTRSGGRVSAAPFWFLSLIAIAFTIGPWAQTIRRFSLRTLLMAITVVAVGLGLIVWLV